MESLPAARRYACRVNPHKAHEGRLVISRLQVGDRGSDGLNWRASFPKPWFLTAAALPSCGVGATYPGWGGCPGAGVSAEPRAGEGWGRELSLFQFPRVPVESLGAGGG